MLVKKLGQPVPDSYFISEVNRGRPQPAQTNTPARFSSLSALVPARSVLSSATPRTPPGGQRAFPPGPSTPHAFPSSSPFDLAGRPVSRADRPVLTNTILQERS